jgi:hypothetical protein
VEEEEEEEEEEKQEEEEEEEISQKLNRLRRKEVGAQARHFLRPRSGSGG